MTKDIRRQIRSIDKEDPHKNLFANAKLNDAIYIKVIETSQISGQLVYSVETLVYFPYNLEDIYEGGDSALFSDPRFYAKLYNKTGIDPQSEEGKKKIEQDKPILELIEVLPTLDPFLFKSKAQQLGLKDGSTRITSTSASMTGVAFRRLSEKRSVTSLSAPWAATPTRMAPGSGSISRNFSPKYGKRATLMVSRTS